MLFRELTALDTAYNYFTSVLNRPPQYTHDIPRGIAEIHLYFHSKNFPDMVCPKNHVSASHYPYVLSQIQVSGRLQAIDQISSRYRDIDDRKSRQSSAQKIRGYPSGNYRIISLQIKLLGIRHVTAFDFHFFETVSALNTVIRLRYQFVMLGKNLTGILKKAAFR